MSKLKNALKRITPLAAATTLALTPTAYSQDSKKEIDVRISVDLELMKNDIGEKSKQKPNPDIVINGVIKDFFRGGMPKRARTIKNNKMEGPDILYEEDGSIYAVVLRENDKMKGIQTIYNKDTFFINYVEGIKSTSLVVVRKGKIESPRQFSATQTNGDDVKKFNTQDYCERELLRFSTLSRKEKNDPNGHYILCDEDSNVVAEFTYRDDVLDGLLTFQDKTGAKVETLFDKGRAIKETRIDKDGNKTSEILQAQKYVPTKEELEKFENRKLEIREQFGLNKKSVTAEIQKSR